MPNTTQLKNALAYDFLHAKVDGASGTSVHATAPDGDTLNFIGHGFTYNSNGVSGGTVTDIDVHALGVTMHIAGNFNAHALYADVTAAQHGYYAPLLALAHGHHVGVDLPHGHFDFVL